MLSKRFFVIGQVAQRTPEYLHVDGSSTVFASKYVNQSAATGSSGERLIFV